MMPLRNCLSSTVVMAAVAVLSGCVQPPTRNAGTDGGTLQGTVRKASSLAPIAGATVSNEGGSLQATTDAQGAYVIGNMPVGAQSVIAAASGCDPQILSASISKGATTTLDFLLSDRTSVFVEVPAPLSGRNPTFKLLSVGVPGVGQSVSDGRFGTVQTRVTETEGLRHEYSRFDPFNKDQSMILLIHLPTGEWRIYRTGSVPYDSNNNLVRRLDVAEARWDVNESDVIWGLQDFRLLKVNVATGQVTVVKDFAVDPVIAPIKAANPDLYRITMKDEGESSIDKRFWAFLIQGTKDDYRVRYLITWDRQTDTVLGVYAIPKGEAGIDWAGMSPKGNWVLVGGDYNNGGKLAGLTMVNKELTQFHRLDYATGHSDVGLDSEGDEVVVMQNVQTDYIDLIPIDPNTKPILQTGGSYDGTNRTPLVRLFYNSESPDNFNGGVHISCNYAGYCIVSTTTDVGAPEQNWLDRTITLVKLDRRHPRVFYLAKVHGTRGEYWEETHATITNDGAQVVWATNWNQKVGREKVWLMQLIMPAGWAQ